MALPDDRNILKFGPPKYAGETEITPAMVESVRQRIRDAGGILTVWAVLHEVRSEYAQLLTVAFLLINGPGAWSLDAVLRKERKFSPARLVQTA